MTETARTVTIVAQTTEVHDLSDTAFGGGVGELMRSGAIAFCEVDLSERVHQVVRDSHPSIAAHNDATSATSPCTAVPAPR